MARLIKEHGPPQFLTPREVQWGKVAVTTVPNPASVRSFIRFGMEPYRLIARTRRWTATAVEISFMIGEREYKGWVWRSGVDDPPPEWAE